MADQRHGRTAGKLIAAARHWAGGGEEKPAPIDAEDLAAWGAVPPPTDADEDDDVCEVWPENWPAVRVFAACATQWRWVSGLASARVGLDYGAVEAVLRMQRVPLPERPETLARVQVLEHEALRVWSRERG